MISEEVLQRVVRSARIRKDDRVLEIGPGLGSLTQYLVDAGARVLAIEKDDTLFRHLQQKFAEASRYKKLVTRNCRPSKLRTPVMEL